ncbi:MAG: S8 family serine peptidase [Actinomycetaceae bacterium]|nr:S8 family serine peptidase [Actinomycetaceae bacterium]
MKSRFYRSGLAPVVALALLGAGLSALPANAEPVTPVVGERMELAGGAMNYAVNLAEGTDEVALMKAQKLAEDEGLGKVLQVYPKLGTFFVQSADGDFANKFANRAGLERLRLVSVGPTRQNPINAHSKELVVNLPSSSSTGLRARTFVKSQLDKEADLNEKFTPDPDTSKAWGIAAVHATEAAQVDVKLSQVTVGVLDSGVKGDHPDLKDQMDVKNSVGCDVNGIPNTDWKAWQGNHYHGTHVAGTIAAANNGVGVDGVAPKVKIAAVRVGNDDGMFYPEYVTCGFVWAGDHKFAVTNNSYYSDPWAYWMPNEPSQAAGLEAVRRAVAYSTRQGVLNVAAAGNENTDLDTVKTEDSSPNDVEGKQIKGRNVEGGFDIPEQLPGVVSVSAVGLFKGEDPSTGKLGRATFSNYGKKWITVAAPGLSIYSTMDPASWRQGEYGTISGTSMASPHAAGVAALLRSVNPSLNPEQVTELLKKHADIDKARLQADKGGAAYEGAGLVNALAAVTKDQPKPNVEVSYQEPGSSEWKPLEPGFELKPESVVRVHATGPVTKVQLKVAGQEVAVKKTTNDEFAQDLELKAIVRIQSAAVRAAALTQAVEVTAFGRNNDERADDDVKLNYEVVRSEAGEPGTGEPGKSEPGKGEPGKDKPGSDNPGTNKPGIDNSGTKKPSANANSAKGRSVLSSTGTQAVVLGLVGMVVTVAGGFATFGARRQRN